MTIRPTVGKAFGAVATLSLIAAGVTLAAPALARTGSASTGHTIRISVSTSGVAGNGHSSTSSISADGRYVAFQSSADNLVAGDTNGSFDVFVRDLVTGTTERVSTTSGGTQGNAGSFAPAISGDGRFVAFVSNATNLVRHDRNRVEDVFVKDRQSGTIRRVSVSSAWTQANGPSDQQPSISSDGRYVAFNSYATNLVPGDTNAERDVFVRDRVARITERVSVSSTGHQANSSSYLRTDSVSGAGRFVVFSSNADNLVPGDTNGTEDVFIRDRVAQTTRRVSVTSAGDQAPEGGTGTAISADGRFVSFDTPDALVPQDTNGTYDAYLWNRRTGTQTRVSVADSGVQANDSSFSGFVSADGRYVLFASSATNLTPEPTTGTLKLFLRDRWAGTTEMVSVNDSGTAANDWVAAGSASTNGRYVTFSTQASNLVPGDAYYTWDVFVRDRG